MMVNTYGFTSPQIFELIMEVKISIAVLIQDGCPCARYLIERQDVLVPKFLQVAHEQMIEPAQVAHRFISKLHEENHDKIPYRVS